MVIIFQSTLQCSIFKDLLFLLQFFSKHCLPSEKESPEVRIDLELVEVGCEDGDMNPRPRLMGFNQMSTTPNGSTCIVNQNHNHHHHSNNNSHNVNDNNATPFLADVDVNGAQCV